MCFEEVKQILKYIRDYEVQFLHHFKKREQKRPITEKMVLGLMKPDKLLNAKTQKAKSIDEKKYRIELKMSRKYKMIVVLLKKAQNINIVTAWNDSRK